MISTGHIPNNAYLYNPVQNLYFGKLGTHERNGLLITNEVKLPVAPGEKPTQRSGIGEVSTTLAELLKEKSGSEISIILPAFKEISEHIKRHPDNWKDTGIQITVPIRYSDKHSSSKSTISFEVLKGKTNKGVPVYVLTTQETVPRVGGSPSFEISQLPLYQYPQYYLILPLINEATLFLAKYLDDSLSNQPDIKEHVRIKPGYEKIEKQSHINYWLTDTECGYLLSLKHQHPELDSTAGVTIVHAKGRGATISYPDPALLATLYGHTNSLSYRRPQKIFNTNPFTAAVINSDALIINAMYHQDLAWDPDLRTIATRFNYGPRKFSFDYHVPTEYQIGNFSSSQTIDSLMVYEGSWGTRNSQPIQYLEHPVKLSTYGFKGLPYNPDNYKPHEELTTVDAQRIIAFKKNNVLSLQHLLHMHEDPDAPIFLYASRIKSSSKNTDLVLRAMSSFLESHPNAQFVFCSHQRPEPDDILNRTLIDRLQEKFPDRFRYIDGQPSIFRILLMACTYHLMVSNKEPFGTSDLYAAGMGTPNIASQVGGILTKFNDSEDPLINVQVSSVLKSRDPDALPYYEKVQQIGSTAIFVPPYNTSAVLNTMSGKDYSKKYQKLEEYPASIQACYESILKGVERAYLLYMIKPEDYAQMVHNNILLTTLVFNEDTASERLERSIKYAVAQVNRN